MFMVTRSLVSVVVTLVPRPTVPPLPATQSEGSATVRTGVVTDDVGVAGVPVPGEAETCVTGGATLTGVVVGVTGGATLTGVVGVGCCVGVVGADTAPVVMSKLLKLA